MKLASLLCGFLSLATVIAGSHEHDFQDSDPEHEATVRNIEYKHDYWKNINAILANLTSGRTADNIEKRIEWVVLRTDDQYGYIDAIKCLHRLPPHTSFSAVPGAKSRYDDFTATHMLQTPFIHFDGLFLAHHHYLVHLFERALRDKCGYTGPTPYFDLSQWWEDPRNSSFLDGSPTSLGGNGE